MAQLPLMRKLAMGNTKKLKQSSIKLNLTTQVAIIQNSDGRVCLVLGTAQMTSKVAYISCFAQMLFGQKHDKFSLVYIVQKFDQKNICCIGNGPVPRMK